MIKFRLGAQINLIFAIVTILSCVIFLLITRASFSSAFVQQSYDQLVQFHKQTVRTYQEFGVAYNFMDHNAFVILINHEYHESSLLRDDEEPIVCQERVAYIIQLVTQSDEECGVRSSFRQYSGIGFVFSCHVDHHTGEVLTVISMTNTETFVSAMSRRIREYTMIAFTTIFLLGNIVIFIFSKSIVDKLQALNKNVTEMTHQNYKLPIESYGDDEISDLAHSIDKLRLDILTNETTKQDMIQNIGHDLKTPIMVIKSYAEAITDKMSENPETDAKIIFKQANYLQRCVEQLLEYSKLNYLDLSDEVTEIKLKDSIEQLVQNYKYKSNVEFITDLDDSTYRIAEPRLINVVSNLIENALRYAQSKIVITLKKQKITIFNDGEPVPEELLPVIFQPYEKGRNGQFGLGLSIVKATLALFDLKIACHNVKDGVEFVISPYNN